MTIHTDHPLRHFDRTCPACLTPPLSWWEHVKLFFGLPRLGWNKCFNCGHEGVVMDLGDSDFVCERCWKNWPYSRRK